ncbi:MAG TPA: hypothetical protein VKG24_10355 [Pseudolabrys sp.]|nr:hypothetical protein [Pseudolabrys sp.]
MAARTLAAGAGAAHYDRIVVGNRHAVHEGTMTEHFETRSKKGRGRAQRSLDLIDAMFDAAEAAQPITGRGIGYKLFAAGLIPSMERSEMQRVYRLLKEAREEGTIAWDWIVDETRELEKVSTWRDPAAYARTVARSYRRDFWIQQPVRCEVWSEKGTVRGVLGPVLDDYAVGFRVMHGFSSATTVHDVAEDYDGRDLIALYVGDFDPSGMYMSEEDLPNRLSKYDGHHVTPKRIALKREQTTGLLSFPAADKKDDKRYPWFVRNYGNRCWELDAMDPNDLRACVKREIKKLIEPVAWKRCEIVNKAEQDSLRGILQKWGKP